ncbi:MarR family winged helix-turn-helix transcriptional regulator [Tunturiibacter gelidoferens]|uniref:MarR family transcriptional regulator n=1 Tax=Tunturiibacter gelidiferens TaxID=3069689 RepID=A0AAU7YXH7_9BACT
MNKRVLSNPGHHINRIARLSARWLEPRLQRLGLAVAQVPVFGAIKSLGPLSQKELARLLHVEQPTMAQLLTRMEREGLIERTPDPKDGRSSLINLTPHALKKAGPARDVLSEGSRVALKGFSPSEITALNRLLLRVRANLEEAIDE